MADWETVPSWENRDGQYLTSRWLNRVQNNLDYLNGFAAFGVSPFRSVRVRGTSLADWSTLWQGWYRHHNSTVTLLWSVWRGDSIAFDDDTAYEPRSDYMAAGGSPSYIRAQIQVGTVWNTLINVDSGTAVGTAGNVTNQGNSAALGTIGMTPGSIYKFKVEGRNGGFEVGRIHMDGAASYTWGTAPSAADGGTVPVGTVATSGTPLAAPSPPGWNTYRHDLLYLKEIIDAPRGPTAGVYDKPGAHAGNTKGSVTARLRMHHRGDTLMFRIGARNNDTVDNAGGWAELYYNNVLVGTAQTTAANGNYVYTTGTANLGTLSLTKGNWYDVELRSRAEQQYTYHVCLDYCFEVDGEPLGAIASKRWSHGTPVRGTTGAGSCRVQDFNDDLGNIKGTVDNHYQFPCPDQSAGWPTSTTVDANDLSFIRQRPQLVWGSSGGTVSLYWGSADAPNNQALGAAGGTADLRGFNGLPVGTRYWLNPRGSVTYAMEQ